MTNAQSLQATIHHVEDLQAVVKTMKALAAVSIRQYERAVDVLGEYSRSIETGFQILLQQRHFQGEPLIPPLLASHSVEFQRVAAIIFGSDRGLCGQFNERIASFALSELQALGLNNDPLIAIAGERLLTPLESENKVIYQQFAVPAAVDAIVDLTAEILLAIEDWQLHKQVDRVILYYNEPSTGTTYNPRQFQLLPIDLDWLHSLSQQSWQTNEIPLLTMDEEAFLSALIREYLSLYLFLAAAASLASENASRLSSMQSAEKNIQDRISDLTSEYRRQRQSAITSELLDVVSGFEALSDHPSS
ncbi:alternate F1F0 ATPase, F1 subunit gamma [Halothece sp. PCC 7418]|uniref:ApNa+ATPase gamma subunit n=1 Tax=Aphanothece halophytica TaxID=72020 RepID=F2Z9N4_APHHA|nr:Na+-translocating F1F0-ATP synthase, F1 subunit gamma [Halothece sp. PCC 7418]AFZ44667.1 alternate F1F0 ATPase, F1 subunit gamma [Halothece sp. PCC 7418]BAK19939.1 ApNa+ATPase gamma subunit [Aphanothece halophytica]